MLVDLSGTPDNRRVMRSLARLSVAVDTWWQRLRGGRGPDVLIFAPAADGKSVNWPDGADLAFTDELLDADAVARINAWVEEYAAHIVDRTEGLWPAHDTLSLGRLNLSIVQEFLLNYAQVTESLRRMLERAPPDRCVILSGYPQIGNAVQRDVSGLAGRIRVRSLPGLPHFLRGNGGVPGRELPIPELGAMHPRVLIVSESRPMSQLFSAVEDQLHAAGVGPGLRIQYGANGQGLEHGERASVLHLPRPELVAPGGTGLHAELRAIEPRIRELARASGPYHPPLDLLFDTVYAHVLPRQLLHVATVRRLLEATRPELVVVGNDRWWIGMTWVLAAREAGIPTLAVQDGVAWDTPMWTSATADHIAVNGTQLEGLLRARGYDADRVTVVGQPRYDGFNEPAAAAIRESARARLGLEDGRMAVMFATQPNQDASYVRCVSEAILAAADVHLLLRPHPSTSPKAAEALSHIAADDRVLPVNTGDIFDLIAASDLVVVQNSTVALEAALLGRPVITANLTGMPDVVPYAQLGVSVEAKDAATVTALVERARDHTLPTSCNNERTRAGIHYLVGPTDGKAAARVADLIGTLLVQAAPH